MQWIGLAFVDEELLQILVATLADVLPHVRVYQARRNSAILLIGSLEPLPLEAGIDAALAAAPASLAVAGLHRSEDLLAALALDEDGARRFAAAAPRNTDRRNHLQIRSPKLRVAGRRSLLRLDEVVARHGLAPELPAGVDRPALVRALVARGFRERARAVAAATPDPVESRLGLALLAENASDRDAALAGYRRVLAERPRAREAQAGLLRILGARTASESPELELDPAGRAVLRGLELAAAGRDAELAGSEEALAAIPPADPLFAEATRLRVRWRVASGVPERGREALELIDGLHAERAIPARLVERARAGALAGDPAAVLGSAEALLAAPRVDPAFAREALRLLRAEALPPSLAARRQAAERRLTALAEGRAGTAPG